MNLKGMAVFLRVSLEHPVSPLGICLRHFES